MISRVLGLVATAAAVALVAACGKLHDTNPFDIGQPMSIAPPTATLHLGDTITFTAAVQAPYSQSDLRWSSSDITHVTVNSTGTAKAIAAPGSASICVTYPGGGSACADVDVEP